MGNTNRTIAEYFDNLHIFNNFVTLVHNNIKSIRTRKFNDQIVAVIRFIYLVLILFSCTLIRNPVWAQNPVITTSFSENTIANANPADSNYQNNVKSKINWTSLPYFFDDLLLTGGVNRSNIYFSSHYSELSHITGFQTGIENYYPVMDKAFIHYGAIFSARGFEHQSQNIRFRTYNFDFPIYLAYELPALREFDLRLLLGAQFTKRTGAIESSSYAATNEATFKYRPSQFARFDFGFTTGLSAEYGNHYFRARVFHGYMKMMPNEQGMNAAFFFDYGYFFFRGLRK
jgi:hypothetical protein